MGLFNPPTRALFLAPPCPNSRCGLSNSEFSPACCFLPRASKMSHHFFCHGNLECKLLSRCPLFAKMAPSPDRVTPQSCHIRNSWRKPKNVIATDSHGLLKCIASSHRLSSMGLQMHLDGNLRLLDQRRSRPGHCSLSCPHPHAAALSASLRAAEKIILSRSGKGLRESTIMTRTCQNRLRKNLPLSHQ